MMNNFLTVKKSHLSLNTLLHFLVITHQIQELLTLTSPAIL